METKKIEQKGFIGNSKFGKHFYALVLGLALVLFGGLYFLVNAENLEIATNLLNTHQTIGRVQITSDGTNDGTPFIDLNGFSQKAIFKNIAKGDVVKKLGINLADELVYEDGGLVDDGDRTIAGQDLYRATGHVSIGTNTMPGGMLNIISDDAGMPELYIEQTSDSASNIRLKTISNRWSIGAYGNTPDDYFFIASSGSVNPFSIEPNGDTSIRGDLYMFDNDIVSVGDITSSDIITAVTFVMSSDESLKKNIKKIVNPLDKIYSLNGYTFDWKSDSRHDIGLIAQEVEKVLPELVQVDTNGHKGVQYANMVALLIEGIKDLGNKVDLLYNKYLDQQNKIDELEKRLEKLELK